MLDRSNLTSTCKLHSGDQSILKFRTEPMLEETEITGHIVARLTVGVAGTPCPKDLDLFVTLRHFDDEGQQVFYTGTAGDPVPLCKGWLRCSLRKVDCKHPAHREYLPRRAYLKGDQEFLTADTEYTVDVEVWPTTVILSKGARLEFEVSSADTQVSFITTPIRKTILRAKIIRAAVSSSIISKATDLPRSSVAPTRYISVMVKITTFFSLLYLRNLPPSYYQIHSDRPPMVSTDMPMAT
jgi:predicted acyl esterase